ncbi:MAG: hypothetical protein SGJ18_04360 [Pseudomonadota bacterium]|nr:hypothetical protein [Pseudomonadota bacterium]
MKTKTIFLLVSLFFASFNANAFVVDVNGLYFTDKLAQTADMTSSKMMADASIGLGLVQDEWFLIGLSFLSGNFTDEAGGVTTKWTSNDLGLRLFVFLDRIKNWGLGVDYNVDARGKLVVGTNTEYWRGSSYKIDFGYTPLLFHKVYFGVRVNYYVSNYDQSSTDNVTFVAEKNTRSMLYPSLYLGLRY